MTTAYRGRHCATDRMPLGAFRDESVRIGCTCPTCTHVGRHRTDLVVTRYTAGSASLANYRRDVRVLPVLQSDHLEIAALKGLAALRLDDAHDKASR